MISNATIFLQTMLEIKWTFEEAAERKSGIHSSDVSTRERMREIALAEIRGAELFNDWGQGGSKKRDLLFMTIEGSNGPGVFCRDHLYSSVID